MGNLAGWPWWKVISITGQAGSGTDYQVKFEIGDSAGGDVHLEGHCTNFPQDIRITDDDGTTLLDHWVEDLTADPIIMNVEVKDDLGSNQDIRIYYGKNGESTASNGVDTFEFFDDFNRSDSPTVGNSWTETGDAQIKDNCLYASGTSSTVYRDFSFSGGQYCLAAKVKKSTYNRQYSLELRDGSYRSILTASLYTSQPNIDSLVSCGPQTVLLDPYSLDTYYIFENCRINTDNFNHYINHGDYSNIGYDPTYATTEDRIHINVAHDAGSDSYTDWVFVRKYNSPEPAFSSAGAEQSAAGAPAGVFYGPLIGPFGGPI